MSKRFNISLVLVSINLMLLAQVWKPLDGGLDNSPTAVTTFGNLTAVASVEGFASGSKVHKVSFWNGSYWLNLPPIYSDSNSVINSLKFYKGGLYIAGRLDTIRGLANAKHLIKWSNRSYQAVSAVSDSIPQNSFIKGLEVYSNFLFVYGGFKIPSVTYGSNLAVYNGTNLLNSLGPAFGSGVNGTINVIYTKDNTLVVGGRFTKANDTLSSNIAQFSAGKWLRYQNNTAIPTKISMVGGRIIFGGYTTSNKSLNFYSITGTGMDSANNVLYAMTELYDLITVGNTVYASGQFYFSESGDAVRLIQLGATKWSAVGNGNILGLRLLTQRHGRLIASGLFVYHNLIKYDHIAEFLPDYGIIQGRIYNDKDKNCEFSNRDERLNQMNVVVQPGNIYIKPSAEGTFIKYLKQGNYTAKIIKHKHWVHADCSKDSMNFSLNKGQVHTNVDFPMVQPSGIQDLSIQLRSFSGLTSEKDGKSTYIVRVKNNGSEFSQNIRVFLNYDSLLEDPSSSQIVDSTYLNGLHWKIPEMYAGETVDIECTFKVNARDVVGELILSATVEGPGHEVFADDNSSQLVQTLSSEEYTYKKEILPSYSDTVYLSTTEESLEYQVSFANYTSDTIFNVYVVDTIKLNHSLSVIQTTGASHDVSSEAFTGLPGEDLGVIIWTFNDINLIPNPNHNPEIVRHKGYVSFRLGLNPGLEDGMVLKNKADITFDYYEAEATNWVYGIVDADLVGIDDIAPPLPIDLYPNPVRQTLFLNMEGLNQSTYEIIAINGSYTERGQVESGQIDVSMLSGGMYFIRIVDDTTVYTSKFIKL